MVKPTAAPTYNDLRAARETDAHHVIQDASAREVPNYSRGDAPAVQLDGPSTAPGTPHYAATQVQRQATTGGTYAAERQVAEEALRAAGCSAEEIEDAFQRADSYFIDQLGLSPESPMRIPQNRPSS